MFDREKYILTDSPIKGELLRLFNKNQRLIILDIGGCEGEESIRYSRIFPNASIFCFEPLPKNQKIISGNILKYKAFNVQLVSEALSDTEGVKEFFVSSGEPDKQSTSGDWDFGNKSSSLLPPDKHLDLVPWIKFEERIKVSTNKASTFLNQQNIAEVDFIHMDVQGAELMVLKGMERKIKSVKAIWLEVAEVPLYKNQPTKFEIEKYLIDNGFCLVKTQMEGAVGDQMYLNKKYFKTFSIFSYNFYFKK